MTTVTLTDRGVTCRTSILFGTDDRREVIAQPLRHNSVQLFIASALPDSFQPQRHTLLYLGWRVKLEANLVKGQKLPHRYLCFAAKPTRLVSFDPKSTSSTEAKAYSAVHLGNGDNSPRFLTTSMSPLSPRHHCANGCTSAKLLNNSSITNRTRLTLAKNSHQGHKLSPRCRLDPFSPRRPRLTLSPLGIRHGVVSEAEISSSLPPKPNSHLGLLNLGVPRSSISPRRHYALILTKTVEDSRNKAAQGILTYNKKKKSNLKKNK